MERKKEISEKERGKQRDERGEGREEKDEIVSFLLPGVVSRPERSIEGHRGWRHLAISVRRGVNFLTFNSERRRRRSIREEGLKEENTARIHILLHKASKSFSSRFLSRARDEGLSLSLL